MLILELNEYNPTLLRRVAERLELKGLKKIFNWRATITRTDDEYDSGYLEPWVQWVSVHTGSPASIHRIKNLGDVPSLSYEQLWEKWSSQGRSSIIWGVMNGDRRSAQNCEIFIPDPWTFSQPAYPEKYYDLIELPRYLAKNYIDVSTAKSLRAGAGLLRALVKYTYWSDFCDSLSFLIRGLWKFGPAHVTFIVFFEHVSAMAFLRAIGEGKPDDAILFMNMFAHVQHHYWRHPEGENCPQLDFAARAIDDIVEKALTRAPETLRRRMCIVNGLSQKCTHDEKPWFLHRQKNPAAFVKYLGLNPISVEPLMTHDAHLTFATPQETEDAIALLERVKIDGKPFFHVEGNQTNPNRLFYRLDFFDQVNADTTFMHGNKESRFHDHFVTIIKRTGKHIQLGEVMANWDGLPDEMYNHDLVEYFLPEALHDANTDAQKYAGRLS